MFNYGSPFMFSTGIENSYPTIALPDGSRYRVDEMESTQHYRHWKRDFELVKELGISYLRYGPPYYKTHLGPGRYDWSFADETFNSLREMDITPLVDMCHFGVPDWIGDFQNPDWPNYFAEYAREFAKRFPWIKFYTPVNEIFIAATFSALYGWWNEKLNSENAFLKALLHLCQANVKAMQAILEVQPQAIFIQSESSEYFHAEDPSCQVIAKFLNEKRFLALDFSYGHSISARMYTYLMDHGIKREEYEWFTKNRVKANCVMGNDYYWTNEHLVRADGTTIASGEIFGYYVITRQYYHRYRIPVMHTETNIHDADKGPQWLRKQWANMHRLKLDGVPVVGFTWYSLTDQIDWDSALRDKAGNVNACGLVDLNRQVRPVGWAYKHLIEQWRDILPVENLSLGAFF